MLIFSYFLIFMILVFLITLGVGVVLHFLFGWVLGKGIAVAGVLTLFALFVVVIYLYTTTIKGV